MSLVPIWVEQAPCWLLQVLPMEIIGKICEEVAGAYNGRRTLALLGRTCRALYSVVMPLLYKNLNDITPHWEWPMTFGPRGHRCQLLLRTLSESPALGRLVRSMDINNDGTGRLCEGLVIPGQYRRLYETLSTVLLGANHITQDARLNPTTALLFVHLAPNLTRLTLTMSHNWCDTSYLLYKPAPHLVQARVTHQALTHLTIRWLGGHFEATGASLHKLNGLLHTVPNLTHLTIERARAGTSVTFRLPRLTVLRLPGAHLCVRGLRNLTRWSPNLVHFEMSHDQGVQWPVRCQPVSPAEVLNCLRPAAASLRWLRVETWVPRPGQQFSVGYQLLQGGVLGAQFTRLKQVAIHWALIGGRLDDEQRLVKLLRGLPELEGIFLFGIEASYEFERQIAALAIAALRDGEWPRLRDLRMQSRADPNPPPQPSSHDLMQHHMQRVQQQMAALITSHVIVATNSWDQATSQFAVPSPEEET
ncbi:uncharacterized protein THITE_2130464 [Thermothielavioides terrestris NRRL 8126]|uniref:F-box domain-containing protein n=2 Tax=Thermothielavioides terrestris TaxID=2587410 RepID=G2R9S3_THETT|nr:uncharacterized protein THITE_2130464 [Thermothielavioides terrestris NRRL 8126]AEO68761.1 hypothetical protein THITE_2130464 [Thermothielavioides terrestris NRRL 8126]